MKQKSKGGKRSGAGRKPVANPKKPITLYVEDTSAQKWGGRHELKKRLYDFIAFPNQFDPQFVSLPISPKQSVDKVSLKKPLGPQLAKISLSEQEIAGMSQKSSEAPNNTPKTLDELKAICPAELKGLDRAEWIAIERQKYGI